MAIQWDKVKADAMKILGREGDIPEPGKLSVIVMMALTSIQQYRDACAAFPDSLDKYRSGVDNAASFYAKFLTATKKSNLGLDPNDKDQAAKIDKARDLLCEYYDEAMNELTDASISMKKFGDAMKSPVIRVKSV